MNRAKNEIVASIARAKLELEDAIEELKEMPMLDPMTLGFIAHAMNNYLHVSRGTIELLHDVLKDHPKKQVGIWLEGLNEVTSRMANLVQEMHTGPSKSPPQMRFEAIDLNMLVDRACRFYRRTAARKQVAIEYEGSIPPPPKVRTDRIAVAAILDNLLSNAVTFSARDKQITVGLRREGNTVLCTVRDEGPGISAEDRPRLFQRGAKLKSRPVGNEPLTSHGLAVAAELVAHLGGEIGCESNSHKGASFFFRLPCPRTRGTSKRRTHLAK